MQRIAKASARESRIRRLLGTSDGVIQSPEVGHALRCAFVSGEQRALRLPAALASCAESRSVRIIMKSWVHRMGEDDRCFEAERATVSRSSRRGAAALAIVCAATRADLSSWWHLAGRRPLKGPFDLFFQPSSRSDASPGYKPRSCKPGLIRLILIFSGSGAL